MRPLAGGALGCSGALELHRRAALRRGADARAAPVAPRCIAPRGGCVWGAHPQTARQQRWSNTWADAWAAKQTARQQRWSDAGAAAGRGGGAGEWAQARARGGSVSASAGD